MDLVLPPVVGVSSVATPTRVAVPAKSRAGHAIRIDCRLPLDVQRADNVAMDTDEVAIGAKEVFGRLAVWHEARYRAPALGDHDLFAALGYLVHELQATSLELGCLDRAAAGLFTHHALRSPPLLAPTVPRRHVRCRFG